MCCALADNGRHCLLSASAAPARSIRSSCCGPRPGSLRTCGVQALLSTMISKALPGAGKALMGPCSRRHWRKRLWGATRRIGGKKGCKRHLLVDGRGVPLSLVVTGANAHDVTQLEAVLASCMIKRPTPKQRRSKHLCADAGYRGKNAMKIILAHGYIPHVVGRKSEAERKKRNPQKKARRWVVEACHGWFNRFRKLLVRYEKLEHTFLALNHLAAAIITLRKISLPVNIIYG